MPGVRFKMEDLGFVTSKNGAAAPPEKIRHMPASVQLASATSYARLRH